jgi:hypothetical protein
MNRIPLTLCVWVLSAFIATGQRPIVIGASRYVIDYAKHAGHATLKNGKHIKGVFEYAEMEFPDYNLRFYSSSEGSLVSRIKFKEIKSIALAGSDTIIMKNDSTYFFNLRNNNKLYRKLTDGDIEIYDSFFNVSKKLGLIREDDLVVVYKDQMRAVNSRKELLQLLESYGRTFQPNDTSTVQAIIKAINENH